MKLRLRSVDTKKTIQVDVPPSTTLRELKRRLSQALPASSASSLYSSDSIRLSFDNKDDLRSSSPDETLQMLGITSGDLIFFTLNPNVHESSKSHITPSLSSNLPAESTGKSDSINLNEKAAELSSNLSVESTKASGFNSLNDRDPEPLDQGEEEKLEFMETDWKEKDADLVSVSAGKSFSVPGFLRKVFNQELSDGDDGRDHKLSLIAVHAVLLESGFVRFDPILGKKVSGLQSPNQRILTEPQDSILSYTLPEIVDSDTDQNSNDVLTVELKFQTVGKVVIVYGYLSGNPSEQCVQLNKLHLVPFLNAAWSNCGLSEEIAGKDGILWTSPEKEVFEFWRTVKDELALPLLIELCEKAGFGLPPCFMQLPPELKLKILELLHAEDLAMMSCLCSDLRHLASNDDLWKQKFENLFGNADSSGNGGNWKQKLSKTLKDRKPRTKVGRTRVFGRLRYTYLPFMSPWQYHIMGDHDRRLQPFHNIRSPSRRVRPASHVPRRLHPRERRNRYFAQLWLEQTH